MAERSKAGDSKSSRR